jgi:hypothetical protein
VTDDRVRADRGVGRIGTELEPSCLDDHLIEEPVTTNSPANPSSSFFRFVRSSMSCQRTSNETVAGTLTPGKIELTKSP